MEEQRDLFEVEDASRWQHYALCDPRYEGPEAIRYIGRVIPSKGVWRRFREHLYEARTPAHKSYNYRCKRGIRKMLRQGVEPLVVALSVGGEGEETRLIDYWEGLGAVLWNQTRGGDGCALVDDEARERRRTASREAQNRPEVKERMVEAIRAARTRPEVRANMSAAQREAHRRPEVKAKHRAACSNPTVRARKSEAQRRPECRERKSAKLKGRVHTPETRAKMSAALKVVAACPEWRARISAASKSAMSRPEVREKLSRTHKERLSQPEAKAAMVAAFNRPEVRAKNSESKTGEKNPASKLNEGRAWWIKTRPRGMTQQSMADLLGVSKSLVRQVKRGVLWGHVEVSRRKSLEISRGVESGPPEEVEGLRPTAG